MVCVTLCASADPPSSSWTVSPTATVGLSATVKVGLVMSVMLSVAEAPESDAATRSGVPPVGAVVSMVTLMAAEATPVLPAASVAVAVRLCAPFAQVPVV